MESSAIAPVIKSSGAHKPCCLDNPGNLTPVPKCLTLRWPKVLEIQKYGTAESENQLPATKGFILAILFLSERPELPKNEENHSYTLLITCLNYSYMLTIPLKANIGVLEQN